MDTKRLPGRKQGMAAPAKSAIKPKRSRSRKIGIFAMFAPDSVRLTCPDFIDTVSPRVTERLAEALMRAARQATSNILDTMDNA